MSEEIRIRLARTRADYDTCVALQEEVWGLEALEVTSAIQMIASTFAGGMVHLADTPEGHSVGFAYAFPALTGGPHLHSDMLAVAPSHQKRGVGAQLKWAQRTDALQRGVPFITWTFDPMQAVNAHLNLRRLGGVATHFYEDFYGRTSSALHHGLPTDRLMVRWQLEAPRVVERAAAPAAAAAPAPPPDLPRVNDVKWQAGWAVSSAPRLDLEEPELLLEIPPEWDVICQTAPRMAEDWQGRMRAAFKAYFARGYVAADFIPTEDAGRRRPFYLLRRG